MTNTISVAAVEDNLSMRNRLQAAIEADTRLEALALFDRAAPVLAWNPVRAPDVMLVDLGLPDMAGTLLIRELRVRWPDCAILVITMFGDDDSILDSIEAGATGYLLKDESLEQVGNAISEINAGGAPMSPVIARKVLDRVRDRGLPSSIRDGVESPLTKREAEILDLMARGYTYAEVARLLDLAVSTVQSHIKRIYAKLVVRSRAEAVFEAQQMGWMPKR